MLNQQSFEEQHQDDWQSLESQLRAMESMRWWKRNRVNAGELPVLYASLCQQHALARGRGYSHALTARLHNLITRAHHQLYRQRIPWLRQSLVFLGGGFAAAVRRERRLLLFASALFFLPALVCGVLSGIWPEYADLFLGSEQRRHLEAMYAPGSGPLRPDGMENAGNFQMFGFYIYNNIGIDFRVFASGILFGVGSVFFSVFNGIVIGAAAGYLTGIGYHENFWGFVAGHSAPELIALCISCTAGLMLGRALVKPGRRSRRMALLSEARGAVPLIVGAALMTLVAAFIEAYWSSLPLSLSTRVVVGLIIWMLVLSYLTLAGRSRGQR